VKLSVVVPAHNEEGSVAETVGGVISALAGAGIEYEVIVVDDGSADATAAAVETIARTDGNVRCIPSHYPRGFGYAVRSGLDVFTGEAVAIVMADGSDDPADLVRYHALLEQGYDCAFGSRFMRGSTVVDYAWSTSGSACSFAPGSTIRRMHSRHIAAR